MPLLPKGLLRFDEFELDPVRRAVTRGGIPLAIPPKAFDVLQYLVLNPARVVTKDELLKAVWPESFVEESNLTQHVSTLRKGLADKASLIVTVPGRGYQFTAAVEDTSASVDLPADSQHFDGDILVQRVRERTHMVIEESSTSRRRTILSQISLRVGLGVTAAAAILAAAGVAAWKRFEKPPEFHRVMVADFLNLTGDKSFDHTLKSAMGGELGQSPFVQMMGSGEQQTALTRMEKATDTPLLGDVALEVCRRSRYQAMLRGKIESLVDKGVYQLTIDVVDCGSGTSMGSFMGEANSKEGVLDALDSLSDSVRRKIGESHQSIANFQVPLIALTTFSFDALEAATEGGELGNAGKLKESIPLFEKAIALDPNYAMALAELGTAYFDLGENAKAGEYAKRALDASGKVSEWEKFYIQYCYYYMTQQDLDASEKVLQDWTRTYPLDGVAWTALTNLAIQRGSYQEAVDAGEQALKITTQRMPMEYEVLGRAYVRASRSADAKRVIAEGEAQNLDSPGMHEVLLEIAIAEHDPESTQREINWSKGKAEPYAFLEYEAIGAADEGKVHESEELFKSAIDSSLKEVGPEYADEVLVDEARVHELLGRTEWVAALLKQVKDKASLEYAVAATRNGDDGAGEAYLKKPGEPPHGTVDEKILVPELKALLALDHHDAAGAVADLAPAAPYELARCEAIEVRGNAYLAAGQGDKAEVEFKKLIANPGVEDPPLPRTTLAHLGLARAYALEHNKSQAAAEYNAFFGLWKDADPDLPPLVTAHREYSELK